jgi:hypothetical protein
MKITVALGSEWSPELFALIRIISDPCPVVTGASVEILLKLYFNIEWYIYTTKNTANIKKYKFNITCIKYLGFIINIINIKVN